MKDRIVGTIFSLTGASLAIGAAGFLSALVTMFIDVNQVISVKWLLFVLLTFSSLTLMLLKVVYDLSTEIKPPPPFEHPVRYVPEEQVFVIKRNDNFLNNIVVGCYLQTHDIDRLAYLAVVHLVQDKVIQIKIRADFGVLQAIPVLPDDLKTIIVRPVVPVTAIEQYNRQENINE